MAENPKEEPKEESAAKDRPDPDLAPLPIESEDRKRAIRWLQENWAETGRTGANCMVCGADVWTVGGPVAFPALRRPLGTAVIAAFTISCQNCGNMLLLNASFPTDLVPDVEPTEEDEKS
jgi:hypothetical protein